jgi:hypothetical protein
MKGLKINFQDTGALISTTETVEGNLTTVQNGLVNIATITGTDKAYPDRGTELFLNAVQRGIPSINLALQYSNFAAIDTLFFLRSTDLVTDNNSAENVQLSIRNFTINKLSLDAQFTMLDGQEIGIENTTVITGA